jgi:5-formyltetrahydrofolate cyclo-ligase
VTAARQETKAELRVRVLAARRAADPADRERAASRLTSSLLDLPDVVAARCVAAYLSFGTEPSTAELIARLRSRGVRVLLPVLREDLDLDWTIYDETRGIPQSDRTLSVSVGKSLGVGALSQADFVVVPALAVGADGTRLGRGGGSYDRALVRVPDGRSVAALLYDGELLPAVPALDHDRRVDMVVQPTGVHRFGTARGGPS